MRLFFIYLQKITKQNRSNTLPSTEFSSIVTRSKRQSSLIKNNVQTTKISNKKDRQTKQTKNSKQKKISLKL